MLLLIAFLTTLMLASVADVRQASFRCVIREFSFKVVVRTIGVVKYVGYVLGTCVLKHLDLSACLPFFLG